MEAIKQDEAATQEVSTKDPLLDSENKNSDKDVEAQNDESHFEKLYHGNDYWNSEKMPILTLIWVREYDNPNGYQKCCSRYWLDFNERLGLSFLYMLTRVGVPIWLMLVAFSGESLFHFLGEAPKNNMSEGLKGIGNLCGLGIAFVVSLTVIKDIQKCFWWFLIFQIAYKPQKTKQNNRKPANRCICIFLSLIDLLIVILCSLSFYFWIWFIGYSGSNISNDSSSNLLFIMTTLPGLLIMQEIDERIGNYLKSGSPIGFDKTLFKFSDNKKRMCRWMKTIRVICAIFIGTGWIGVGALGVILGRW